jgi:phenylalanyl-tRNA synthetase alpha chain
MITCIEPAALVRALALRDLTDPDQGIHAIQQIVDDIQQALSARWQCPRLCWRASPLVEVRDNYDALGYPPEAAAREARYTRYVTERLMLRSQTSAQIPGLLRALALDVPEDVLLVCPGVVYRRDSIDRLHVGEPHQLDLWRLARHRLDASDLDEMIALVVDAALPGRRYRTVAADHPYTVDGRQIDVADGDDWVEIGECGLAAPPVLARAGIDRTAVSGLAMGLGLDRLMMLRKGIDDIRLLRADDPRIAPQMCDLDPYRAVSRHPPIRRDLSIAVPEAATAESLGDRIREAMGDDVDALESLDVVAEVQWGALPEPARARLGMMPHQKNVLLRLTMRHPSRTLTRQQANRLRNRVYQALHEGAVAQWAEEGAD